ncbi:MAG: hypothetical protein RR655_05130, partial [Raoultibacter sp.]
MPSRPAFADFFGHLDLKMDGTTSSPVLDICPQARIPSKGNGMSNSKMHTVTINMGQANGS